MVFQDGGMYLEPPASVPTVFDNLIHKGEMPVTVGLFVNPGTILTLVAAFIAWRTALPRFHKPCAGYGEGLIVN
jgi:hypothetical protein